MGDPNQPNEVHLAADRTKLNAAIDMVLRHDRNAARYLLLKLRLLESNEQRKIRNKSKRDAERRAARRGPNANVQINADIIRQLRNEIGLRLHIRARELKHGEFQQQIEDLQAQVNDLRQRLDLPAERRNDNLEENNPFDFM